MDFRLGEHLFARLAGTYGQPGWLRRRVQLRLRAHRSQRVPPAVGGIKCKEYSLGDTGYKALRGSLRFNPSDSLDMLLSADYISDHHNNGAEILVYGNNANPNANTPNGLPSRQSRFLCGKWCNYTTLGNAGRRASWRA